MNNKKIKIITTKKKCCGGKEGKKIILTLPFGINKAFIVKCREKGFTDNPKLTENGIINLNYKNFVTISGLLCLKNLQVHCKISSCDEKIEEMISVLEEIIKEMSK